MSSQITLAIQPSLALPERWSVDYWYNDRPKAVYQAGLFTFESRGEAETAAANMQSNLESRGMKVTAVHFDTNASKTIVSRSSDETEEEIAKRLQDYVKSAYSPIQKLSLSSLFDVSNWPKWLKAIVSGSPHVLSLIVLAALLFRGSFERLLGFVMPKELDLGTTMLLASAPLLLLATTLSVYFKRARLSSQLDRVKNWILHAVIFYGWDEYRFRSLVRKELAGLEYASALNMFEQLNQQDPSSFDDLARTFDQSADREGLATALVSLNDQKQLTTTERFLLKVVTTLVRDDFARKVQALAGMSGEPDYRPAQLAILPFHVLISFDVNPTMLGLLNGNIAIASSKTFHEDRLKVGMMLFLLLTTFLAICPALVWSTALSWRVSSMLFIFNIAASALTIFLLSWRPVEVAFKHRFIPRGLSLHECAGALNLM